MINWKYLTNLIEYPQSGIISKEVIKNKTIDVSLFCLAKGAEISEHTSTRQGIVYVIEGNGLFNLEGEKIIMKKDTLIFMAENEVHSLKSEDNLAFVLILYKK